MSGVADLDLLGSYDFALPDGLIAQQPVSPRDACRLLVLHRQSGKFEHRRFTDLPEYLDERDLGILNDTRVLPARFVGHRVREGGEMGGDKGGRVEFVLLEEREPCVWEGLFHASAKYLPGLRFEFATPDGRGLRGELIVGSKDMPQGTVVARFDRDPVTSGAGQLPLPHYIDRGRDRGRANEAADASAYQTVYARHAGSAAAPTAGLHFTDGVLKQLRDKKVELQTLTLHVGLGTFRPVKEENVARHRMHEERYFVPDVTAQAVTEAKRAGRSIFAVGTTSVRTLESAWAGDSLAAGPGRTSIFIRPGDYSFKVIDKMLTNFHLPRSTLLMLVCAFAGKDRVLSAYREAVREEYRFFSYGDAMLIV